MPMSLQPDLDRDVIVQHVPGDAGTARWAVFLGRDKRTELDTANGAQMFARLLADLQQRPAWVQHQSGDLVPLDHRGLHGCSCC